MTRRWFLLLILIVEVVWADEPSTQPFLRVEAEAHTAAINQLALTRDGRILSVSPDKTARIWDEMLNPVATIRVPIGSGAEGALYAAAASPDKDSAVVAGTTAVSWEGGPALYAVDLKTNLIKGRLGGLPGTVTALAYSDDGRYLAIGTGAFPLLRVYDLTTNVMAISDPSYGDRLSAILFLPDGRLVTAALDGKVRLYSQDFRLIASQSMPQKARPKWLARSPSGDRLAVGTLERKAVNILSTKKLQPVLELLPLNKQRAGNFSAVAWSGSWIFGAGTYSDDAGFYLHAWNIDGNSPSWEIKIADDAVTSLLAMSKQRLAFATNDATIGIVDTATQKVQTRPRAIADFRDAYQGVFAINQDASLIDFGTVVGGKSPLRFDLKQRRIINSPGLRADLLAPQIPKDARDWRNNPRPIINGKLIALEKNEFSRAIAAHNDLVALGADYSLRLLRAGISTWKVDLASTAWAVNISGDGRYVIAALGDGTLRWYTTNNGVETMALFVTTDRRWILWTPEGYFDHSPNADNLIGYHKNTGRATAPEFVSATQLYNDFFRPELINNKWAGKDLTPAMQYTGHATDIVAKQIPPDINLLGYCVQKDCHQFDGAPLVVTQRDVILRVAVNDRGSGIGKLTLKRNNGVMAVRGFARTSTSAHVAIPVASQSCSEDNTKRCVAVELEPGENYIELSARDGKNTVDGNPLNVMVRYELPTTIDNNLTRNLNIAGPALYIVSIGINNYNDEISPYARDLTNAESDAIGIAEELSLSNLYQTVKVVGKLGTNGIPEAKPLLGKNATLQNIQQALGYVADQARPEDVVVLFIAGHGLNQEDEKAHPVYHFLTYDTTIHLPRCGEPELIPNTLTLIHDNVFQNSLDQKILASLINNIKAAKVSILLDTCHSGQALDSGDARSVGSLSKDTGRFMLAGTASEEEALDGIKGPDGQGHGVFTGVLMAGLHGKADIYKKDGFVDVKELSDYIDDSMQEEVNKINPRHTQHATTFLMGTRLREFRLTKNKVEPSIP